MKNLVLAIVAIIFVIPTIKAQDEPNPITTAAPFLLITPDARAGGMGDVGVATSPDANSLHHNPAKFSFMDSQFKVGIIYTPWLRELTNDVFLGGFTVANRINDRSAWAASLKYFNLGEIELTDGGGFPIGTEKLNEFSLDGSYSLKLSDYFGMGVAMSYIRSDLGIKSADAAINPVNTFTVGVSGYFQTDEQNYGSFNGRWRGGFNIANIGPKVSYTDGGSENFVPTNLKLGGGFDFVLDEYNRINTTIEITKLLVPTPPIYGDHDDDPSTPDEIIRGRDNNVGFAKGMFQSFYDAPDGFSEEMAEVTWALGVEYMYNNAFALRTGYFHESDLKGARQFFTIGAGFRFKSAELDVSYLFNASDVNNPLENTLRFSFAFNFGDVYEDY
ncbi:MAG: hypothetical protein COB73_09635 [Flavobacteriaceae bacterium]|nr:MAG: hypothetical protein COB73_09635 [Flavobacteriaceae bacterium]